MPYGIYPHKRGSQNPARDQQIIKLLDSGLFTLAEVGKKYGLSRQRAQQIYIKLTGKKPQVRIQKKQLEKEAKLHRPAFTCRICHQIVTYENRHGRHTMCENCVASGQGWNPKTNFTLSCPWCHTPFHPTVEAYRHPRKFGPYCSRGCMRHVAIRQAILARRKGVRINVAS